MNEAILSKYQTLREDSKAWRYQMREERGKQFTFLAAVSSSQQPGQSVFQ